MLYDSINHSRVLAMYQIMLGWKQYECFYETVEFPKTQDKPNPRKIRLKVAFGLLFPTGKYFFVGWDWFHVGNRLQQA